MGEVEDQLSANLVEEDRDFGADGNAFLGAVHNLVSGDRAATKADLILAAACQALRSGDKTLPEVVSLVNAIWPGASTDEPSVAHALALGAELGLVVKRRGLELELWTLSTRGIQDVDRQAEWVDGTKRRIRLELVERARVELGIEATDQMSRLWLEALVRALIDGIQSSQDAYLGNVEQVVGRRLSPKGIDQERVLARFDDPRMNPVVADFLRAAAIAALDPLDPFGDNLVSHITTGCVLHSYVAGRDASSMIDRLGSPRGQRALVDTPTLVDLIGPTRVQVGAETTLAIAVSSGWEVIVCEHSIEELIGLIEREVPKITRDFARANERGIKAEWYASLVEDQLPSYCIEALRTGQYSSLDKMIDAARMLKPRLEAMGILVREHGNDADSERVEKCRIALEADLGDRVRSAQVVQRDADSMAMVWRRRRKQKGSQWPGGWVITSDRHMGPAYRVVQSSDPVSLTLSMAQWNTLLSATVEPTDVVELAVAAANQLVEEAMWLLPSRFPASVAMELARQISPNKGGSDLDLRFAQFSLHHLLNEAGESRSGVSLASDVLAAREQRIQALQSMQLSDAAEEVATSRRLADAAASQVALEKSRAEEANGRADQAQAESSRLADELEWSRRRTGRIVIVVFLAFMGVGVILAAVIFAWPALAWVAAAIGLSTIALSSYRWITDRSSRLAPIIIAAAFEAVGLVSGIVTFFPVAIAT